MYRSLLPPEKKRLPMEPVVEFFSTELGNSCVTPAQARFAFAMSRMTEVADPSDINNISMLPVEFYEMICRIADIRFRNSELESQDLEVKLKHVLDDILATIKETTIIPETCVDCISASDEDY